MQIYNIDNELSKIMGVDDKGPIELNRKFFSAQIYKITKNL